MTHLYVNGTLHLPTRDTHSMSTQKTGRGHIWGVRPTQIQSGQSGMLECVAVCCSVLQSVVVCAVCCSVLQCAAMCCSVLQCVAVCCSILVHMKRTTEQGTAKKTLFLNLFPHRFRMKPLWSDICFVLLLDTFLADKFSLSSSFCSLCSLSPSTALPPTPLSLCCFLSFSISFSRSLSLSRARALSLSFCFALLLSFSNSLYLSSHSCFCLYLSSHSSVFCTLHAEWDGYNQELFCKKLYFGMVLFWHSSFQKKPDTLSCSAHAAIRGLNTL